MVKPSEQRVWLKHYKPEAEKAVLPKCTVYEYLKRSQPKDLSLTALYYYGTKVSYGELLAKIEKYADCFAALGVKRGEYVVFLSVNLPETIASFYALNKIGAVPVLVEPRMGAERIRYFIEMVRARTLIVIDLAYHKVAKTVDEFKLEHVIVQSLEDSLPPLKGLYRRVTVKKPAIPLDHKRIITTKDFEKLYGKARAQEVPYEEGAVCAITQTGGTTGIPKGVELTNDGLNAVALNFLYSWDKLLDIRRFLNIMPFYTSYGLVCGLHSPLSLNCELILVPDFTPERFPDLIRKFRPDSTIAVPSFYEKLLNNPKMDKVDLSNLVFAVSGGDHMNAQLEERLNAFLKEHGAPYPIAQGYGLSETSAATAFTFGNNYRKTSVGVPLMTSTIGIFKPGTTEELGYGETGEICVHGPSMMRGYFNNPEETANVMRRHPDGRVWVHSGDLGHMDEDGFLFFDGRIKYVIPRFDGHKNFPVQIEQVVMRHPDVANCAVVGVRDREHSQGMYPLVVAVLKEQSKPADEARIEILQLCEDVLEERGQPCDVVIVDEIPLTQFGKNDIAALCKRFEDYDYVGSRMALNR